jgi:hypothetical protein
MEAIVKFVSFLRINVKPISMNQLHPLASRMALAFFILFLSYTSNSQSNYAISFDGTDDYVSTSSYVVPTSGDFTVELWVYATNYTGYQDFRNRFLYRNHQYFGYHPLW